MRIGEWEPMSEEPKCSETILTKYPDLFILRHGETEWNLAGRMQGHLDSPLTVVGREQARKQGRLLSQVVTDACAWFSSPQGRAFNTAQIAAPNGQHIQQDIRLKEIGMGDWTGMTRHEIGLVRPDLFKKGAAPLSYYGQAPGSESINCVAERARDFLSSLTTPAVIVTHGITSRVLRCVALDLDPSCFAQLNGGQGIVYAICNSEYGALDDDGWRSEAFP